MSRSDAICACYCGHPFIRNCFDSSSRNRDCKKRIDKAFLKFILKARFCGKNMAATPQAIVLSKKVVSRDAFIAKARGCHKIACYKIATCSHRITVRNAVYIISGFLPQCVNTGWRKIGWPCRNAILIFGAYEIEKISVYAYAFVENIKCI